MHHFNSFRTRLSGNARGLPEIELVHPDEGIWAAGYYIGSMAQVVDNVTFWV